MGEEFESDRLITSEAELEAKERRQRIRQETQERSDRLHAGDWVVGWLIAAQRAPYRHSRDLSESYLVKVKTSQGIETLWGTDLERAVRESRSKVKLGSAVGVRITASEDYVAYLPDGGQEERTKNYYEIERATYIVKAQKTARLILSERISDRRLQDGSVITASELISASAEMLADTYRLPPGHRREFVQRVQLAAGILPSASEADPSVTGKPSSPQEEARLRAADFYSGAWLHGRLIEAGPAPYHKVPGASESYFVKLRTSYGLQTVWGVELKTAVEKSKSNVEPRQDVAIRITSTDKLVTDSGLRKTWRHYEIEQEGYIARRERAAETILADPITARRLGRDVRAVRAGYLLTAGADMLADSRMLESEERNSFLARIRAAAALPNMDSQKKRVGGLAVNQNRVPEARSLEFERQY